MRWRALRSLHRPPCVGAWGHSRAHRCAGARRPGASPHTSPHARLHTPYRCVERRRCASARRPHVPTRQRVWRHSAGRVSPRGQSESPTSDFSFRFSMILDFGFWISAKLRADAPARVRCANTNNCNARTPQHVKQKKPSLPMLRLPRTIRARARADTNTHTHTHRHTHAHTHTHTHPRA